MIRVCLLALFFQFIALSVWAQTAAKLYNTGFHYLNVDRDKAIENFTRAIEEEPQYIEAYLQRGLAHYKNDDFENAIKDFDQVLNIDPDQSLVYIYKGFAYRKLGDIKTAIKFYSRYIEMNPRDTSAYAYILRGKIRHVDGDFSGAVDDFSKATELDPFREKYHYYKFLALYDKKLFKSALKEIDEVLSFDAENYAYYYYKANTLLELGQSKEAIDHYDKSIDLNHGNPDAFYKRARAYENLKGFDNAFEDYSMAIFQSPHEGTYYSARGNFHYTRGHKEAACEDWYTAGGLGYYEDFEKMKRICK